MRVPLNQQFYMNKPTQDKIKQVSPFLLVELDGNTCIYAMFTNLRYISHAYHFISFTYNQYANSDLQHVCTFTIRPTIISCVPNLLQVEVSTLYIYIYIYIYMD